MYLLDTNVLSEIVKRVPNAGVMAGFDLHPKDHLFASEVTRYELKFGASLLDDALAFWARIERRVVPAVNWLSVTHAIAERGAEIAAALQRSGRQAKNPFDPLLAATADVHGLILVTRNVRDFERVPDLRVENWFGEG